MSGSEDHTLKLWQIPADHDHLNATEIHAAYTERAHDKGIASVVVAPNDKFIASGSMDKTAKVGINCVQSRACHCAIDHSTRQLVQVRMSTGAEMAQ